MRIRLFGIITAAVISLAGHSSPTQVRRQILYEEFTSWNCSSCGLWDPFVEPLLTRDSATVNAVWYHGWYPGLNNDPMYNWQPARADDSSRYDYYSVPGEPTGELDGQTAHFSASVGADTSLVQAQFDSELAAPVPLALTVAQSPLGGDSIDVRVVITCSENLPGAYYLRIAIVKKEIDTIGGTNGQTAFVNVCQTMLPDSRGTPVTVTSGTQTFNRPYGIADLMPSKNATIVYAIAWVQNDDSKEVENSAIDDGYYFSSTIAPPVAGIAAPGETVSYYSTITNTSASPAIVTGSLTPGTIPPPWRLNYTVNGTSYSDTMILTLAPFATASIAVSFRMYGGKGIGTATFQMNEFVTDTIRQWVCRYCAASSDVTTAIIDATGGTSRAEMYESAMAHIPSAVYGSFPSMFDDAMFSADTSFKTLIYVAGANVPPADDYGKLTAFLKAGGNLFITGEIIASRAYYQSLTGNETGSQFLSGMLHTQGVPTHYDGGYDCETGALRGFTGASGDSVSGVPAAIVCPNAAVDGLNPEIMLNYPDALLPADSDAKAIFTYTGTDTVAGIRMHAQAGGATYKAVYLAFGLEAMGNVASRNQLMSNVMEWFGAPDADAVPEPTMFAPCQSSIANYPNPFTGTTTIVFSVPITGETSITLYDMRGVQSATIAHSVMQAGTHVIQWNGGGLPAGVYECRMRAPNGMKTGILTVVQ